MSKILGVVRDCIDFCHGIQGIGATYHSYAVLFRYYRETILELRVDHGIVDDDNL